MGSHPRRASSIFFSRIISSEALVYNSYIFLEQPFCGNYSILDSNINTVISDAVVHPSRWLPKTVTRPIEGGVIRFFYRHEKGTGAEMCPAIVSGIVTGDAPVG